MRHSSPLPPATLRTAPILLLVRSALVVVLLLALGGSRAAWAIERGTDGWFHTGDGVRVRKAVTVTVEGGGTATIPGVDFMKVVWSFWLGRNDQPSLSQRNKK